MTPENLANMSNRCARSVITNIRPFTQRLAQQLKAKMQDADINHGWIADKEVEILYVLLFL